MQAAFKKNYDLFTYPIFTIGTNTFSLSSITNIILLLLIVLIIARITKTISKQWLLARLKFDAGNREAISTMLTYFVSTIGTIAVLQASGLNLTSLAVLAGGLGIGIGFGLQSVTKDFISGLVLLLGRSIKINDFVQFGERQEFKNLQGTVTEISLLFTIIQTKDGGSLILPNSYLVIYPILNWSYGLQKNRLRIPIKLGKDSDIVLFTETVLNATYLESTILKNPSPKLVLKEFGENYCEFELQVWVEQIKDEQITINALNYAIEYHLRQQGISLFFPTNELLLREQKFPFSILIDKQQNSITSSGSEIFPHLNQLNTKTLSVRDLLQKVAYFENFTELELRQLIEVGYRKRLEKEKVLFDEGAPGDAFYIVLSGSVEVFVSRIEKHLAILKAGSFFGELSLILGIPRTASVRALEPTVLFAIDSQGFKQLLQEQPELAEVIIKELEKHQEELAQRQKQLREMGLIDKDEDDSNLVAWVRKRLGKLFSLKMIDKA